VTVPFLDLQAQHRPLRDEILAAWAEIYDSTAFVAGPRVEAFEQAFAAAHGSTHAVAVSNGTAALELALRALGIGHGDRVIVPANTFIATAEAVSNVGATPLLVDCDPDTRTISVEDAVRAMDEPGVRAVLPVHLYGQPADMDPIVEAAERRGVAVVEDAAQGHLARYKGRPVGSLGVMACFSFYPGKNLGAPGEGGAVTTSDDALAAKLQVLRNHGQAVKYHSDVVGGNARMHEMVGAALAIKLPHLAAWTEARRRAAAWYHEELEDVAGIDLFPEPAGAYSVYHLFVVEVDDRDRVLAALNDAGIGAALHYPVPVHLQEAYASLGLREGSFPNAERSASRLLSLPMFAEITRDQVARVATALRNAVLESRSVPAGFGERG
jgi:dTDP-4-amino-4,6-dideoxygalactose transaminase